LTTSTQKYQQFNNATQNYDEVFTYSTIGKLQRKRVYYWLHKINFFKEFKKVFEINCGTGYDAEKFIAEGHNVIATDGSESMIRYAKKNRDTSIHFFPLSFEKVAQNNDFKSCNTLFSNFGGLNCISNKELQVFAKNIGKNQKKKDLLIWVLMSKFSLIESLYFLLKLKFKRAFIRNTTKAVSVNVEGISVDTYYHSPKAVKNMLAPNYDIKLIKPVAFFLPPSYMEAFFIKNKILLYFLYKLENIFGRFSYFAKFSDHYIVVAEKQSDFTTE